LLLIAGPPAVLRLTTRWPGSCREEHGHGSRGVRPGWSRPCHHEPAVA
jgi:hypothetical protein